MDKPFIGREAVDSGRLTPHRLRSRFTVLFPGVYVAVESTVKARTKAEAAFLWSRRRGIVAGRSAAAVHGSKWLNADAPAELIYDNRHQPDGIRTWADRIADDEIEVIDGMRVTTPPRTALDLACHLPLDRAVAALDALARATHLKPADVDLLVARYRGRNGIRKALVALDLMDPGAQSPRETWLRLLVIRAGYPRPDTQVPVHNEYGVVVAHLDMGWEGKRIALEYEGAHHRLDREQFAYDIRKHEQVREAGWRALRVTSMDTEGVVLGRLAAEWNRRRT